MKERKTTERTRTQVITYDFDTGEIIRDVTYAARSDNGKDWSIMYQMTMYLLATDKSFKPADIRVYLYIAANADFQCCFKTTQVDMAKELGLSQPVVVDAVKTLKEKDLIRVARTHGQTTFFLNPYYITRGKDRGKLLKAYEGIPRPVRERIDLNAKIEEVAQSF